MIALAAPLAAVLLAAWEPCWDPVDHGLRWEGYEEGEVVPRGSLDAPRGLRLFRAGAPAWAAWPAAYTT